jgi:hypothetical protein
MTVSRAKRDHQAWKGKDDKKIGCVSVDESEEGPDSVGFKKQKLQVGHLKLLLKGDTIGVARYSLIDLFRLKRIDTLTKIVTVSLGRPG